MGKDAGLGLPQVVLALPRHCSSLGLSFSISGRRHITSAQDRKLQRQRGP